MICCFGIISSVELGFPGGSDSKESACNVGDLGSIPGLGISLGGGHGNPFQYSCQRSMAGYSHSVMSDSATPWTAARQASLSITNTWSLLKLVSIESAMPSSCY